MKRLVPFLLIALLAVACSKEEVVSPCDTSSEHIDAKDLKPTNDVETGSAASSASENGGLPGSDPDGTDISDDGDDLSDSERSRKKRR